MIPGSTSLHGTLPESATDSMPPISSDLLDGFLLPSSSATARTVNKFAPKPRGKTKKSVPVNSKQFAAPLPITSNAEKEAVLTNQENPKQFQPKSGSGPKERKPKSVSFSLPDDVESGAHFKVSANDSPGVDTSFIQRRNDESVNKDANSTFITSANVDIQLDHESAENEDLANSSGLEFLDDILSEPTSDKANPCTNLANGHADPIEMSPLEAGSPGGDEEYETIDIEMYRDSYTGEQEKVSTVSENTCNEEQSLDDQSTTKVFKEHGAGKSKMELRKRVAGYMDAENPSNSHMDEDLNDDDHIGEDIPKQQEEVGRSRRKMTDAEKPAKRHRKTAKESDTAKTEPPKKRFPHGAPRKRRRVDKVLLETPEYEIDPRQMVFRDLIVLAGVRERISSKEDASLRNHKSNTGSFSNDSRSAQDNFYDQDLDPDGDEAHRNMLRNSRKLNYQTHMNKTKSSRWSKAETALFYEAMRQFGSDFGMIGQLFPDKTRGQIKSKFKTEERKHPSEVRDAMIHRSSDHSHFERVIQKLQAQAEEDSSLNCANYNPPIVSEDAANENQEERGEPENEKQVAKDFDGEAANSEKKDELDYEDCESLDLNEYESFNWDAGASSTQNEEKHSEYSELV